MKLQSKNGGDVEIGKKLGLHLVTAGFKGVQMSVRYECHRSPEVIGEYLALQLDREGDGTSADVFRKWSRSDPCMFAQTWVATMATKS
jgi:hypothetical protein